MDKRIYTKSDPKLFDKAILPIQVAFANNLPWLDNIFGICESLTDVKEGKRFTSANYYMGNGKYKQIMPCKELGNFCFFTLKDPHQVIDTFPNRVKCPISLVIWLDMRKVSLPTDERNFEAIKGQILGLINALHLQHFNVTRIYEKPQNVFADYSYDYTNNQFLMSPYAGLRIDGVIGATIPCVEICPPSDGAFDCSYNNDYDI